MSPSLIGIGVVALVVIVLLCMAIYVVPQQQAYIIERFGKFRSVRFAGIHLLIPFVDRIAMKTNMRVSQLNVKLETKTLDNVFVTIVASTQYRVNPDNVAKAYYELRDPQGQLRSYMEDALRSAIPMLTLDDAFAMGDSVAADAADGGFRNGALRLHRGEDADHGHRPEPRGEISHGLDQRGPARKGGDSPACRGHAHPDRDLRWPLKRRRCVCRARVRRITAARSPMALWTRSRACRKLAWTLAR